MSNFEGYGGPSEHRTVRPHCAFCLGCSMWCYLGRGVADPCVCCANALHAASRSASSSDGTET